MSKFVLVKHTLDGQVSEFSIDIRYLFVQQAITGSTYTLIDRSSGEALAPLDLRLRSVEDDLVIEAEGEVIARINDFFAETITAFFETGYNDIIVQSTDVSVLDEATTTLVWEANDSDGFGMCLVAGIPLSSSVPNPITQLSNMVVANPMTAAVAAGATVAGTVAVTADDSDTTPPEAVIFALDTISGTDNSNLFTNVGTVNVSNIEADAIWEYTLDGGATWITGTGTSFDLADDTTYAEGDIQVRQTDGAGNISEATQLNAITTDMTPPDALGIVLDADTGASGDDATSNVGTVNITNLEADASWEYTLDGGDTWSTGTGTSFSLADDVVYGEDDVQVRQTDVAGNVSATATQEFTTDMSSPVLTDFTPIAQATDIATDSNITVTFNEAIIALEGNLTLSDGGSDVRTIDIHDTTQVTISNNILTINPTEQLQSDSTYSVNMEAGVISDIAGNSSLGVNSINFTTEVEPPAYFTVNSIGVFHDINQNGRYDENESYLNTHDNTQDTFSNIINDIADVNNESVTLRLTTVNMDTLNLAGFGADDLLIVDVVSNYTMKFFTNNNNIMEREYANFVYSINEGHASRTHTLTGFELNNSFVFKIFTQNTEGKHFLNWSASDSNRTIGTFAVWSSSTDSVLNFGSSGSITNSGQYSDADTATGVQVIFPDISIPGLP